MTLQEKYGHVADCQQNVIEWRDVNTLYGPEETGWCIPMGDDSGADVYINISYCPWCGGELIPPKDE